MLNSGLDWPMNAPAQTKKTFFVVKMTISMRQTSAVSLSGTELPEQKVVRNYCQHC